jgi:flavin-dependent dehydrogenase
MGKGLHLIIVGGSAAGPSAAASARRKNPEANIVILEKGEYISYGA